MIFDTVSINVTEMAMRVMKAGIETGAGKGIEAGAETGKGTEEEIEREKIG